MRGAKSIFFLGSAGIVLAGSSFTAGAAQGTAIGTLSVRGGTGTYTFTLTNSNGGAVQVAGANGQNLQVGATVSGIGSFPITVHADNGSGSTFNATFLISANSAAFAGSLDFSNTSDPNNSQYLPLVTGV